MRARDPVAAKAVDEALGARGKGPFPPSGGIDRGGRAMPVVHSEEAAIDAEQAAAKPDWRQLAEAVREILSGTKPETMDRDLSTSLVLHGLISREEVEKPCRTCGKPQHDYSWWKVSPAGRLLVAALDEIVPPEMRADG